MKKILLLAISTTLYTAGFCQSITGSWKRVSTTLEYKNGKKEDMQKNVQSGLPCTAGTKYYFKADGTHYTQSPAGCEVVDKMSKATWKQVGSTLTVVTGTDLKLKTGGTTYILSFSGNTVTLVHVYTDAENKQTGTKVKKISIVYQKI
ncbi:hypothetical protein [Ferruginibacter sp. HRS2-29]|uniref:hypothetical protein n=1 Tax=Ferruginibacter sp. HRS2-29 TaxID=2487334 RepID=UPI0020CF78B5|nr:hypothetical protein [Ferruginibacter sp. HRS2-29]MCP9751806.1 hypothetical protein [Ferruginibacter sp. HRS2-29]